MILRLPWMLAFSVCSAGCAHEVSTSLQATSPVELLPLLVRESSFPTIVLLDSTVVLPPQELDWVVRQPWADSARSQLTAAVRDLQERGRTRWPLDTAAVRTVGIKSVSQTPDRQFLVGPGGLTVLSVSPVGFSRDSSISVVYWRYHCGVLCGGSQLSFFVRSPDGSWRPFHSEPLMRS